MCPCFLEAISFPRSNESCDCKCVANVGRGTVLSSQPPFYLPQHFLSIISEKMKGKDMYIYARSVPVYNTDQV